MTKSKISLLGSLFVAGALAAAGCGGGGGGGGTGGKADREPAAKADGGRRHRHGGTGGSWRRCSGTATGGAGVRHDRRRSGHGRRATMQMVPLTRRRARHRSVLAIWLLFAFDNGSITGWEHQQSDPADAGLAPTIAGTTNDGNACPGAVPHSAVHGVWWHWEHRTGADRLSVLQQWRTKVLRGLLEGPHGSEGRDGQLRRDRRNSAVCWARQQCVADDLSVHRAIHGRNQLECLAAVHARPQRVLLR